MPWIPPYVRRMLDPAKPFDIIGYIDDRGYAVASDKLGKPIISSKDHIDVLKYILESGGWVYLFGHWKIDDQVVVKSGVSIKLFGGKIEYTGDVEKPFIVFEGNNQGSFLVMTRIGGRNAAPAVWIKNDVYQSLIHIISSDIGFGYGEPDSFKSKWGLIVKGCDVLTIIDSYIAGRDIGARLGGGQDHYLDNVHVVVLPEGLDDEANKVALWRNTVADSYADLAEGTLHWVQGSYNAPGSTAMKLRSLNFLSQVYGERAKRIIDATVAEVFAEQCSFKQIDDDNPDYTFYLDNVAYFVLRRCRIESATTATAMMYLINMPSGAIVSLEENDVFTKPSTVFDGPDKWALRIGRNKGLEGELKGATTITGDGTTTEFIVVDDIDDKLASTKVAVKLASDKYGVVPLVYDKDGDSKIEIVAKFLSAPASGETVTIYYDVQVVEV